jgi:hypothetical protein
MNVGYSEMKPLFESGWVLTPEPSSKYLLVADRLGSRATL